ncbi:MAG: hypothetical protein VR65_07325 [Desulfobulbaceae bacterium BRH_c16a]|nr:MAG: hypothetical protein VR65_07325 [Desulfobulbaceae bacterium BRH_c16a]
MFFLSASELWSEQLPLTFTDSANREITLERTPRRVVSLVPAMTEILVRLGAADSVVGITIPSILPPETAGKAIVGGFFHPDIDRVAELRPEVVFYGSLHEQAIAGLLDKAVCIRLTPRTIDESFADIRLLGKIFNASDKAAALIAEQQHELDVIALKVANIPANERQRVIRLMGTEPLMVPGDDSFQNEYIRRAGGIAPQFGHNGNIIPISLAQWQQFNPQIIYSCGRSRTFPLLQQPGWRDVDAVRNQRILFFPCELTCRLANGSGAFVSWLSASIYGEAFSKEDQYALAQEIVDRRALPIDLASVRQAEIITSNIADFRNKTLVVSFNRPMTVVSTLEGQKSGITAVANHFFPPPAWGLSHPRGLAGMRETDLRVLGLDTDSTAMLFTGVDMDNLAVIKKSWRQMEVIALVTAGVEGNAMRMGTDIGSFYEPEAPDTIAKPGTINILLLSNMKLTPRAMTRAIISATEGKTAAIEDLDIRSSYSGGSHSATGTGTDNIIVAEGEGQIIDATGGHTKMGELIAATVHDGVLEAIRRQNGLTAGRSIFKRLEERNIDLSKICHNDSALRTRVEQLLLQPRYASFLAAAFTISDEYERGLISDLAAFNSWCQAVADAIAGRPVILGEAADLDLPPVLAKAMAVFLGDHARTGTIGNIAQATQPVEK